MNLFCRLFRKRAKSDVPPMPEWAEIINMMYDQHLDGYTDEIIRVIYSKDRSKRYVILKNDRGFFTYQLEVIALHDPADRKYLASNKNALPAMWEPDCVAGKSVFGNTDDLLEEMKTEPEYRRYF